ncbi:alpha/beta hydrolase [Saccharothrix sp. S26]|uniref:alpha/beta fold hydrolase n=1 Tax=Saccharothrix sp. S26 TaxID=2907215 RepID=UPI001F3A3A37|nr:alpha/beta fold hydrolase [Saccharothrix sp. S26]MCE6997896.1 alpha/beta hydrolase [Saccharothrix sp. S26]
MTTYVLVHGAWHGGWAWERVAPLLTATGAHVVTPDLTHDRDVGLADHVDEVVAALDAVTDPGAVLVGHSYAGLVVRQAADRRPDRVAHVVLVDGWAGPDGASLVDLAPGWFGEAMAAAAGPDGLIAPPPPASYGVTDPDDAEWLRRRLRTHALRTFTEPTRLTGAVDRLPGTGVHCVPGTFPFARFAADLGYRTLPVEGPHDVPLTDPRAVADVLLAVGSEEAPTLG